MSRSFFLCVLCALCGFSLSATVNEPLRFELASGYRNDRIHWHLQNTENDAITYTELNRDVQFWENAAVLKTIYRDLAFYLRGSYGFFGRGNCYQKYAELPYTNDQPDFHFLTHGWCADVSGYFGYAVNLTDGRTYKVLLTPLLGLSGHFEKLQRSQPSPNPWFSSNAVDVNEYTLQSHLNPLHMNWWGFFLGVNLGFQSTGPLILNVGYTYHWIRAKVHTKFQNEAVLGSPPISDTFTSTSLKASEGGNLGHTGWAQLDYRLGCFWRVGVGGLIRYYSTKVIKTFLHQQTEEILPASPPERSTFPEQFKLRWTPISGWIQVSREI